MSVVSLVILPANAVRVVVVVVVQEDIVAAALDIAEAQVMDEVLVGDPQDTAVCHLVGAAIAGPQHIVDVKKCHMPTEMV